jgi:hypothetical protein
MQCNNCTLCACIDSSVTSPFLSCTILPLLGYQLP